MLQKIFLAIIIILTLNSCIKLYSYPSDNNEYPQNKASMMPPDMNQYNQTNSQMPPQMLNFQDQRMLSPQEQGNPVISRESEYPENVPHPYGMQKRSNDFNDRKLVEDLEQYQKQQQYGGYNHYRSEQYKKQLEK